MTMVSIPTAIPLAAGRPSPSLASTHQRMASKARSTPQQSPFASAAFDQGAFDGKAMAVDEPVPPALDCALLAAPPSAVNHLCRARLQLLTTLPSMGIAWSLWCGNCGALREGFCASAGGDDTPRQSAAAGCKRGIDGEVKVIDDVDDVEDELERELRRALAAMEQSSPAPTPLPTSAVARRPQRRRKMPQCTSCGTRFRRPTPAPPPYPPARAAVRTRRQSALAQQVTPDEDKADSRASAESRPLSPEGSVEASELFGSSGAASPAASQLTASTPAPPSLSRTPSLAHIPKSDPNPPTYPKPQLAPPPKPNGGNVSTTLPVSTAQPPAKKRKTKKSGLAKLLAQNAARESEKSGSGSWGLG